MPDDQVDQHVDRLSDLAVTDRAAFDRAVAEYVAQPGDWEPVYRDPSLAEATLDSLDRLIQSQTIRVSRPNYEGRRHHARLIAERKAVRPIAGAERDRRNRLTLRDSPRNRAARRLAKEACAGCGAPLAAQYLRLVREEQTLDPEGAT